MKSVIKMQIEISFFLWVRSSLLVCSFSLHRPCLFVSSNRICFLSKFLFMKFSLCYNIACWDYMQWLYILHVEFYSLVITLTSKQSCTPLSVCEAESLYYTISIIAFLCVCAVRHVLVCFWSPCLSCVVCRFCWLQPVRTTFIVVFRVFSRTSF